MDHYEFRRLLTSFYVVLAFFEIFVCAGAFSQPVGCDIILYPNKKEDICGVCEGDGSTCSLINGVSVEDTFEVGYNDILLIPAGSTSISIKKAPSSRNFLAIKNVEGRFYLNGNWKIEDSQEIPLAGTVFHYERNPHDPSAPEVLEARGPTTEALFIVLLYQEKNQGISYKYAVPTAVKTSSSDIYIWSTGELQECSQTCGGGVQNRPVECLRESDRNIVGDRLCDPVTKPYVQEHCNNQPCASSWKRGKWSNCSQKCGGGMKFRFVYCHQQIEGKIVVTPDEKCKSPKPSVMRRCKLKKECPDWVAGEWSQCDGLCGVGIQNRAVECHSKVTGKVIEDNQCNSKQRPADKKSCSLKPCKGLRWIVSDWSECSVLCGGGERTRKTDCFLEDKVVDSNQCDPNEKPLNKENCNMTPCDRDPRTESSCTDFIGFHFICKLVVKARLCHIEHKRIFCCGSCRSQLQ